MEMLRSRSLSRREPFESSIGEAAVEPGTAQLATSCTRGKDYGLGRAAQVPAEQSSQQAQQAQQKESPKPRAGLASEIPAATSKPRALSSSRLSFLRRALRSKSDENIHIAAALLRVPAQEEADTGDKRKELKNASHSEDPAQTSANSEPETETSSEANPDTTPEGPHEQTRDDIKEPDDAAPSAAACEVFLNASIQLLHLQSDARQRIRQLWFTVQRLRWEGQLSDAGVEILHMELLAIVKSLNMEKLDGARHLKSGYLTLVQAPHATGAKPPVAMAKSLFSGRQIAGQRMWCTLSEEHGTLEMTPARDETPPRSESVNAPPTAGEGSASTSGISPLAGLSSKFKLPASLSWLLADALQGPGNPEPARTVKLHGCQVRKTPTASTRSGHGASSDPDGTKDSEARHQLQILVPTVRSNNESAAPAFRSDTSDSPQASYGIFAFEVASCDGGEDEVEAWMRSLDRVSMFHLYMLERSIRDVRSVGQYRQVLARHFPLCISLSWLRNRIERHDPLHGKSGRDQQQQMYQQHQQQQRRSSRNLSMIQIIKDLERDKVLVDQKLITTDSSNNTNRSEQDNISEVVKCVVMKVMAFVKQCEQRAKHERVHCSSATASSGLAAPPPNSPTNRFTKYTEAKALAFVERVLRGSSRTQSGGDIYDAISFFCQHSRVSICPASHAACPVQMNIVSDVELDLFQVEIQVCMRFKVIEMIPMTATTPSPSSSSAAAAASPEAPCTLRSPTSTACFDNDSGVVNSSNPDGLKEWAILEGTLSRQFTLGKLSEPGAVTIAYIQEDVRRDGDTNAAGDRSKQTGSPQRKEEKRAC